MRVMDDSAQKAVRMRRSVFVAEAGDLITYVFAAMADAPASGEAIWPYVAKGGPIRIHPRSALVRRA